MSDFIGNLSTVSLQVLILFLLVAIGYACGKAKILNETAVKAISTLCLTFATPAVIIKSFIRPFSADMAYSLVFSIIAATLCHVIGIGIAHAVFRKGDIAKRNVLRASAVLSNAGFMGLPLQAAILGNEGTFFGSAYVIIFTLFLWTYGFVTLSAGKEKLSIKKLVLNPGVIAVIIGIPLFVFSVETPEIITTTVNHVANLNTPLPMIVVGYYLSKTSFKNAFSKNMNYPAIIVRLFVIPLASVLVLYLLGFRGSLFVSNIISVSTPIAVAVTMFTSRFDGDTELSANMVSVSTLFSILSMPLIVAFAQTIA